MTKNFIDGSKFTIRTDLKESGYFAFDHNREYMEIYSRSPNKPNKIYTKLLKILPDTYARLNINDLSPEDYPFYRNTETPFRFIYCGTSVKNSIYLLPTKYNIPLIGGVEIDDTVLRNQPLDETLTSYLPMKKYVTTIKYLNAHQTIQKNQKNMEKIASKFNFDVGDSDMYFDMNSELFSIHKEPNVDFKQNLTLLAYDIETYTPVNLDPTKEENYIFCIGMGFFGAIDKFPFASLCIITKDLIPPTACVVTSTSLYNRICYKISGEYTTEEIDTAFYIIAENECDLLELFIKILTDYHPQLITGFNTFGFDDNFIYERIKRYSLTDSFTQVFSYYNLDLLKNEFWFKQFIPKFCKFSLKIDNEPYENNQTMRSHIVQNLDVYKIILKDDPKRFTQYGRGNLDSMLEAYKVKNPYNDTPLSKTDMKITVMFDLWNKNAEIYKIALYCRQDAWICGTLLNTKSKITDFIENALMCNTQLSDSIYSADGFRVSMSILAYAYKLGYAHMDVSSPFRHTDTSIESKTESSAIEQKKLGGKVYDKRTIIGGAVENRQAGRQIFVMALDFSSQYPSQKEASNVDASSFVDSIILADPEKYGLEIVNKIQITDMYGKRDIIYVRKSV
jgi:DNA polymerase elongation subunit (family B)